MMSMVSSSMVFSRLELLCWVGVGVIGMCDCGDGLLIIVCIICMVCGWLLGLCLCLKLSVLLMIGWVVL